MGSLTSKNGRLIGMRSTMEKFGSHFYIHFIYTDDVPNTFYGRICTNRDDVALYDQYIVPIHETG